jgi:hypothetical protein
VPAAALLIVVVLPLPFSPVVRISGSSLLMLLLMLLVVLFLMISLPHDDEHLFHLSFERCSGPPVSISQFES